MKKLVTLAFTIYTVTAFAQSSTKWKGSAVDNNTLGTSSTVYQLIDSVYMWNWDTTVTNWVLNIKNVDRAYDAKNNLLREVNKHFEANTWVNMERYLYTYDASNNLVGDVIDVWDGVAWANGTKESMIYDASNNQVSQASLSWNGSAWDNNAQYFFTYSATGKRTEEVRQQGKGTAWENDFKHFLTYDANDNIVTDGRQLWDKTTSAWVNKTRTVATYDANNLLTKKEAQTWSNNAWMSFLEYTYTYDNKKNLVEQLLKSTQGANQNYDTYSYDANNKLVHQVNQSWTGSAWKNQYQYFYEYDANKNNTLRRSESWNGTAWVSFTLRLEDYDQDNFTEKTSYKYWNKTGTKVIKGDSIEYYYHTATTSVKELTAENNQLKVYPNPTAGNFKLLLENKQPVSYVELYNMMGELIRREKSTELNISNEAAGVYLLKVVAGDQLYTQRIILQ
jgi:hypothetical protein